MTYKQDKQEYDRRVEALQKVETLDEGPGKGVPVKVESVYSIGYDSNLGVYNSSECLAAGPFKANFDDHYAIKGQLGDYILYLLDKDLDPQQKITIIQRGETARILNNYRVILTFNYDCTPTTTRNLAAALAVLILDDDTTLDKAIVKLLHPQKDDRESDF